MKKLVSFGLLSVLQFVGCALSTAQQISSDTDSLPDVFQGSYIDLIEKQYRSEAALAFRKHQLPGNKVEWQAYKASLRSRIFEQTAAVTNSDLPLAIQQTGVKQLNGYSVQNVSFQTRPGVRATANLYVPDGPGSFPAVIAMHGHWPDGKTNEVVQSLGHTLALNGYVCLILDAFGSGERTTEHAVHEYHGSNLGASLMNAGHTLMGEQISDNIRGVDLLYSLPYVDKNNIGATGASGGGNQTMWLSALDERIKASMPVVSVGTFESYIMRSNCVCELLPGGLTFTEEAGVLAMIAPRALKIATALHDANLTFTYPEMLKSYQSAQKVFTMMGAFDKISYQLFDTGHGYWPQMRQSMLGFFDLYLKEKGSGAAKQEIPFKLLDKEQLMVYKPQQRDTAVLSIQEFAKIAGSALKKYNRGQNSIDVQNKRQELQKLLGISNPIKLAGVTTYGEKGGWQRFSMQTSDNRLIPLLLKKPKAGSSDYTVILNPSGKNAVDLNWLSRMEQSNNGIVIADLWGSGQSHSQATAGFDKNLTPFHTLARASLWLGKTVIGNWVSEIDMITQLVKIQTPTAKISFHAEKEASIAALFYEAIHGQGHRLVLSHCPVSYEFDQRQTVDYFGMSIHIPAVLQWGDVALACALTKAEITFENPVSMSGTEIRDEKLVAVKSEFERLAKICKKKTPVNFN